MWRGGDAEAIEQLVGLAAARNLADGEALHRDAGAGDRFGHRVADAARRVVILDGDEAAAGRAAGGDQAAAIDRRDRIEIDHANRRARRPSADRTP